MRSEPVSSWNRHLLILSMKKRQPLVGVQTCTAIDACSVSFPAGGRRRAAYTFVIGFLIGDGTSRGCS
jgi:hypothetical protein